MEKIAIAASAAACLTLTCAIPPASATSFSLDNSDLWGNPAENGWGLQIGHFTAPSSNPGSKGCTLKGTLVGIRQ